MMSSLGTCWIGGWKKKSTGEIIKVVSTILSSSDGDKIVWADKNGNCNSCNLEEFEKEFEMVIPDYNSYKDYIAELCYQSFDFSRLGKIAMKRLDPNYFNVGDVVYIDTAYRSFINPTKTDDYYSFGPECPYVIVSITNNIDRHTREIRIVKKEKYVKESEYPSYDYSIPLYINFPRIGDAYWVLCRYDKLY